MRGKVINLSSLHDAKVPKPVFFQLLGISMEVRPRQLQNTLSPRPFFVKLSGRVTDVIPHRAKASLPIFLTPRGIVREVRRPQPLNALPLIVVTESGSVMQLRSSQCSNEYPPMLVTVSGSVMPQRLDLRNALRPIDRTPTGTAV